MLTILTTSYAILTALHIQSELSFCFLRVVQLNAGPPDVVEGYVDPLDVAEGGADGEHETWISPEDPQVTSGGQVALLRVLGRGSTAHRNRYSCVCGRGGRGVVGGGGVYREFPTRMVYLNHDI